MRRRVGYDRVVVLSANACFGVRRDVWPVFGSISRRRPSRPALAEIELREAVMAGAGLRTPGSEQTLFDVLRYAVSPERRIPATAQN